MKRTKSIRAISSVIISLLFLLAANLTKAADRPNVLLIVCDDLNTHVEPAGYEPIHTPVMKQFATQSPNVSAGVLPISRLRPLTRFVHERTLSGINWGTR